MSLRQYYCQSGIRSDHEFELPTSFSNLVTTYVSLSNEKRAKFSRAAYWYSQYRAVWQSSVSLSYICLIAALESLGDPPPAGIPCPKCGRDSGPGVTRRFNELLDRLVPPTGTNELSRRDLYRMRSKLAHGGGLLRLDAEREAFLHPATSAERQLIGDARRLTQLALVEWLLAQSPQRPLPN